MVTAIHSRQHPHIPPTPCAKMPSRRLSASYFSAATKPPFSPVVAGGGG
ncbi:hypothetical protein ECPA42_0544, partial [Escherichia coli PA42]